MYYIFLEINAFMLSNNKYNTNKQDRWLCGHVTNYWIEQDGMYKAKLTVYFIERLKLTVALSKY